MQWLFLFKELSSSSARSVTRTRDSKSQGRGFEPHVGCHLLSCDEIIVNFDNLHVSLKTFINTHSVLWYDFCYHTCRICDKI